MMDDVIVNKAAILERCVQRIREEYEGHEKEWRENYTVQDSIVLNLQRACEAAIDMAAHIVRVKKLGIPQQSRDVFIFLSDKNILPEHLGVRLQKMVGFRNIAVHNYQDLKLEIIEYIIEKDLKDFLEFSSVLLKL